MPQLIKSRENELIKYITSLVKSSAKRKEYGVFVAEGARLCAEIAKTLTPQKVLYTQKAAERYSEVLSFSGEHYVIEEHVSDKMSATKSSQGVFALFSMPKQNESAILQNGNYIVLENVQNPNNLGACIRSAAAFGFDGAILLGDCADAFSDKALRSCAGACARINIITLQDTESALQALAQNNVVVYAAALQGSKPIGDVRHDETKGKALLIGNEGSGLSDIALKAANEIVKIPISDNAESLNAAVAAGIMLYLFRVGN